MEVCAYPGVVRDGGQEYLSPFVLFFGETAKRSFLRTRNGGCSQTDERIKIVRQTMSQTTSSSETARSSLHHPRFAAFYEWMTQLGPCRRMADPQRQELVSQASGVVLEIGD